MILAVSMMLSVQTVDIALAADVEPEEIEQVQTVQTVAGFAQEGQQIGTVAFSLGQAEEELTAQMPQYLDVTLADGTMTQVPVTWTSLGGYGETDDFYYQFIPQLDDTYALAEGLDLLTQAPYIMAERQDETEQPVVSEDEGLQAEDTVPQTEDAASQTEDAAPQTDDTTMTAEYAASSNISTIYSFLTQKCGFNTAAACGILANIECESSFNPNLYGDNGTSYGICQWHNERLTAMQNWCKQNGYNWQSLTGQLYYLKKELSANNAAYLYNGLTIQNKLKASANSESGAYSAGYNWCFYYEIPANKETVAVTRGNKAKTTYWAKYGGRATNYSTSKSVDQIFSDVKKGDWYCDAVQYVYNNNIMVGVSSKKFVPNEKLDRAMAAAITYNMSRENAKFRLKSTNSSKFKDVPSSRWYATAVNWAAGAGLINGLSKTKFAPEETLTREQFAVVLCNYAKKLGYNVSTKQSLKGFSDSASVSGYAQNAMKWAVSKKIFTGSKLRPRAALTRAEAAEMVYKFSAVIK